MECAFFPSLRTLTFFLATQDCIYRLQEVMFHLIVREELHAKVAPCIPVFSKTGNVTRILHWN